MSSFDTKAIESELLTGDDVVAEKLISSYIKYVDIPNISMLMSLLKNSTSFYVKSEIIKGLSYNGWNDNDFRDLILNYASGIEGDEDDLVRLSALSAMPSVVPKDLARSKLVSALYSENEIVRDAAVEAAQIYCDIDPDKRKWGAGRGDLIDRVDPIVRRWMNHSDGAANA